MAALFIIAQTWKQPRRPLVGEWIKKLWCIQSVEYYLALKKLSYQATRRQGGILNAYY